MAIPIIPADQALNVSAIITYIYADPGLGKTSLGFTADKAISFDFDRGAHRTGELAELLFQFSSGQILKTLLNKT